VWIKTSLVGALAVFGLAQVEAQVEAKEPRKPAAQAGVPGEQRAGARFTALSGEGPCPQVKLWLDGEGWVVRRVPLCR
jgi:hypothetical protein